LAAILRRPDATLERQSVQLLGYFDALFQRLMLGPQARSAVDGPKSGAEPSLDCSREEIRALILLGASGRITMTRLADRLGVPLSTATHTIVRLVAKSLAVRARTEEDRRVVQVELSDYGKRLQAKFNVKRLAVARSWLEPLSSGERELFLHLMAKITKLAQPDSAPPAHYPQPGKEARPKHAACCIRPRSCFWTSPRWVSIRRRAISSGPTYKLNDEERVTVFMTTHYMEEAERVAHRIAIIDHGKIVAQGSAAKLKEQTGAETLEQAFLLLTGSTIRQEEASSLDQMRNMARMFRGRRR
jgi:DNA-binding MarR family transcriptional regulator